jgi:hypothetical protein
MIDVPARGSIVAARMAEPFTNGFNAIPMNAPEGTANFLTARDLNSSADLPSKALPDQ